MKLVEPPPVEAAYLSLPSRDLGGDTQAPRAAGQWVLLAGSPGTPQKQLDPPHPTVVAIYSRDVSFGLFV